jgi:hypothetical protein
MCPICRFRDASRYATPQNPKPRSPATPTRSLAPSPAVLANLRSKNSGTSRKRVESRFAKRVAQFTMSTCPRLQAAPGYGLQRSAHARTHLLFQRFPSQVGARKSSRIFAANVVAFQFNTKAVDPKIATPYADLVVGEPLSTGPLLMLLLCLHISAPPVNTKATADLIHSGVPKEGHPGERRVALTPAGVGSLLKAGFKSVNVEKNAGREAGFYVSPLPTCSNSAATDLPQCHPLHLRTLSTPPLGLLL